ncbi:phosphoglucosamine mutase [Allohahella sp. A8]|uniref:phosphoglucosamine mutase n=1 Tax=Allohahella sp. A8 TaxID=3141461 RepID=UPI000C0A9DE4|nr:phosphoglucosamine mutase [Hahellaceae bacterium]|tara:strand:+ start:36874 stop:38211 length:1338 start_codon:yes stop_codon:yes gene_type:complete
MRRKYFGTDGIRGEVGKGAITPEFMLRLGWAAGRVFRKEGKRNRVLIGKDTRISGYMFESALEAGFAAAGMEVALLGPMPTPAVAYLTRTFRASAGVVISASHNPYYDNGIKFFSSEGVKLPDSVEMEIESLLDHEIEVVGGDQLGRATRIDDAKGRYIEFCKSTVPFQMSFANFHIVIDCAQGAAYQVAPKVFRELGAKVDSIGVDPDGLNINRESGATSPERLAAKVLELGADLGIALDGDGDRVIMVDHKGEVVDGDEILFMIAMSRQTQCRLRGGVVGTLMTNFGAELAFKANDIPFVRAKVGDRYVMEELRKRGWLLGGEGSGHIVCLENTTTGDGIISGLQVLAAMFEADKSLHELKQHMTKVPQVLINVRINEQRDPMQIPEVAQALAAAESKLNGAGRVLLRASGTEPLIRVMVEGSDEALVRSQAEELAEVVKASM